MKKLLLILVLLTAAASAQFTAVTATVLDPSGAPYASCSYTASLVLPTTGASVSATINGTPVNPSTVTGKCDPSGALSIRLTSNNKTSPITQWSFTICSQQIAQPSPAAQPAPVKVCFSTAISITGGSQNISSTLQAAAKPLTATQSITPANCALTPLYVGVNGYVVNLSVCHANITLNTAATFTDSPVNMIPAGATIEDVSCRVTTTITTAANWSYTCADSNQNFATWATATGLVACGATATGAGNRFVDETTTLAAGTTLKINNGISSFGGSPIPILATSANSAAQKLRILTDVNPGAGAVSCTVTATASSGPTS